MKVRGKIVPFERTSARLAGKGVAVYGKPNLVSGAGLDCHSDGIQGHVRGLRVREVFRDCRAMAGSRTTTNFTLVG